MVRRGAVGYAAADAAPSAISICGRSSRRSLTPGPWFEAADTLLSASGRLYNLLDKPHESDVDDVYDALWRTLAAYSSGARFVNRARIRIVNIDSTLNRVAEDRRLQRWYREHRRIARVSRCLRGRSGDGRSVIVPPNLERIRFDGDHSEELPPPPENSAPFRDGGGA